MSKTIWPAIAAYVLERSTHWSVGRQEAFVAFEGTAMPAMPIYEYLQRYVKKLCIGLRSVP